MSHDNPYRNVMRCPVCFGRDIDVLMIHSGGEQHRCPKCSFQGQESEARAMYRDIQKKFHWMGRRVTLAEQRAL